MGHDLHEFDNLDRILGALAHFAASSALRELCLSNGPDRLYRPRANRRQASNELRGPVGGCHWRCWYAGALGFGEVMKLGLISAILSENKPNRCQNRR